MVVKKDYNKLLDTLDDRLALGKISEENYERLREKYLSELEKTDKKVAVKRKIRKAIEDVEEDLETPKKLHVVHRVERPVETQKPKKKMGLGFKLFILMIIGVSYLYLDLMAAQQMEVSLSGLNLPSVEITQSTVDGRLRLHNPTPIPVILGNVNYVLSYGSDTMAETSTGFIIIMPMASQDVDFDLRISHTGIFNSFVSFMGGIFTGQQQSAYLTISTGFGPIQIPIAQQKVG